MYTCNYVYVLMCARSSMNMRVHTHGGQRATLGAIPSNVMSFQMCCVKKYPQSTGNILEEGVGRMPEAEVRKTCCKIVYFGGGRAVVLRNSQQLRSPAQDLLQYQPN